MANKYKILKKGSGRGNRESEVVRVSTGLNVLNGQYQMADVKRVCDELNGKRDERFRSSMWAVNLELIA